jgi:hypothetical protein
MNPTLEQLERAFPGKGQEILNLIEKRTLTTSYASVLRMISKNQDTPPPYCKLLLVAIAEVVSADTYAWFDGANYFGFSKGGNKVVWDFTLNSVVLTTKGN